MANKVKVPLDELKRMLDNGVTATACARHFGVSNQAITNAKKKLKLGITKSVVLEHASQAVAGSLNTIGQLQKINADAHELLDLCMRWMRGEDEAIQILESQVRRVRYGQGDDVHEVTEYKFKDPREIALKAMARIEAQLKLQIDIFQTLYDLEAAQEFQEEILDAIGKEAPETRDAIVRRLQEKRALRAAIQLTPTLDGE